MYLFDCWFNIIILMDDQYGSTSQLYVNASISKLFYLDILFTTEFLKFLVSALKAFRVLQSSAALGSRRLGLENGLLLSLLLKVNFYFYIVTLLCMRVDKLPINLQHFYLKKRG